MYHSYIETQKGRLYFICSSDSLIWMGTPAQPLQKGTTWVKKHFSSANITEGNEVPIITQVKKQVTSYLSGRQTLFSIPLTLRGTHFQVSVWDAIKTIPYGTTVSYSALADCIGKKTAVRALGTACGSNPVSLIVPCHRVVGSNGSLVGYGGGLEVKKWLLQLEKTAIL